MPHTRKPRLVLPDQSKKYDVGYAKPPVVTQFAPGRSGNPKGRPKGAKNKRPALNEERLKGIVLDEAYRTIKVNDGDKQVDVPIAQAIVRSLAVNAARGQHRAQRLFAELLSETERSHKALHDEWLRTAIDYKNHWDQEILRCRRQGLPEPQPLPHPDDIVIDMRTGQVIVKGPMTPEEKVHWDWMRDRLSEANQEIAFLERRLKREKDPAKRRTTEGDIAQERKIASMITSVTAAKPLGGES